MRWERYREGCGRGVEEVSFDVICRCGEYAWAREANEDGRAHPYEEPAYEVYKMEDF